MELGRRKGLHRLRSTGGLPRRRLYICSNLVPELLPVFFLEGGLWASIGSQVQRMPLSALVVVAAVGASVAFAVKLFADFEYAIGIVNQMDKSDDSTVHVKELIATFGESNIYRTNLLLVPPEGTRIGDVHSPWLAAACTALSAIASEVRVAGYPMSLANYTGLVSYGGTCVASQLRHAIDGGSDSERAAAHATLDRLTSTYTNPEQTATTVTVTLTLDLFSSEGREWIQQMRDAIDRQWTRAAAGVDLGQIHLASEAVSQLDSAQKAYDFVPLMLGVPRPMSAPAPRDHAPSNRPPP